MTQSSFQVILQASPFLAMMLLTAMGSDFRSKYTDSISNTLEEREIHSGAAINALEEDGFYSYQCTMVKTQFDFSIIATIIVFSSSGFSTSNVSWGAFGILAIGLLVILRRFFVQYLEGRAPNRYLLQDYKNVFGEFRIYYGSIGVILSNLVPILLIVASVIFS